MQARLLEHTAPPPLDTSTVRARCPTRILEAPDDSGKTNATLSFFCLMIHNVLIFVLYSFVFSNFYFLFIFFLLSPKNDRRSMRCCIANALLHIASAGRCSKSQKLGNSADLDQNSAQRRPGSKLGQANCLLCYAPSAASDHPSICLDMSSCAFSAAF